MSKQQEWADSIAATKALVGTEATTVYSQFFGRWVRVLRVGKTITSDFQTISDALANSQKFDRVEVEAGSYYESIAIPHAIELTTTDNGEDAVISTRGPCITIATDEAVMISRLSVQGRGQRSGDCVAVLVGRGSPVIQDCLLTAVHVVGVATPTITHCTIENSEAGSGLRLSDHCGGEYTFNDIRFHRNECVKIACSGRPLFKKNRIYQKSAMMSVVSIAGGRYAADCAPILIDNFISGSNHFASNVAPVPLPSTSNSNNNNNGDGSNNNTGSSSRARSEGVLFDRPTQLLERNFSVPDGLIAVSWGASPTILNNTLLQGIVGIHLGECYIPAGQFENNRITQCSSWGLYLGRNAAAHVINNEFSNNAGGIRSQAADSIVEDCVVSRNEHYGVMVHEAAAVFLKNQIDRSECGVVILRNCSGLRFIGNTVRQNTICGIEIVRNGICTLEDNIVINNQGVGFLVSDCSNVRLEKNTAKDNDTNILVRGQSNVHMVGNKLTKAVAHSLVFSEQSYGLVEGNDISQSPTLALVAIVERSKPLFIGNSIRSSASSGVLIESRATPEFRGNQFSSLRDGIRVRLKGEPLVEGNEFQSCSQALLCEDGGLCTFVSNTVRSCSYAFAVSKSGSYPTIRANDCKASASYGISIEEGGGGVVEKNFIGDCAVGCCRLTGPLSDAFVTNNQFCRSSGYGLLVEHFAKGTIVGNTFDTISRFAIGTISEGTPLVQKNHVKSADECGVFCVAAGGAFQRNVIEGCRVAGIHVKEGSVASFSQNQVSRCTASGITVSKGARCTFTKDVVSSNAGVGVIVNGDANSCELKEVVIRDNESHGVKVMSDGSCLFDHCDISENSGDGIHLSSAGDVLFTECSIMRHVHGVACCDGGQASLEHCRIDGGGASDGLVFVFQQGKLSMQRCEIQNSKTSGIKTTSNGDLTLSDGCSIATCAKAGIEICSDSHVVAEICNITDCDVGVLLCGIVAESSNQDRSSNAYHPGDLARRRSVKSLRRTNSTVSMVAEKSVFEVAVSPTIPNLDDGLSVTQRAAQDLRRSGSVVNVSGLPQVSIILEDPVQARPAPTPPAYSELSKLNISSCTSAGVSCVKQGRGRIHDSQVMGGQSGIRMSEESDVSLDGVVVTNARVQGLLVEGTPLPSAEVVSCQFRNCDGPGGVIKMTGSTFTIKKTLFEKNGGGGLIMRSSSIRLFECTVERHETFGMWFCDGDTSECAQCIVENNRENGLVVFGPKTHPVFRICTVRGAENAVSSIEGSSLTMTQCTISTSRNGIAVYPTGSSLDEGVALADSEWNERYRGGAIRRRTSVNATAAAIAVSSSSSSSLVMSPSSLSYGSSGSPMAISSQRVSGSISPRSGAVIGIIHMDSCMIEHNSVGVDLRSTLSTLNMEKCTFTSCTTHSVVVSRLATAKISSCSINGSSSGALLQAESNATVESSVFSHNRVGILLQGNSACQITECTFEENSDSGMVACDRLASVVCQKNLFKHNGRQGLDVSTLCLFTVTQNEFREEHCGLRIRDASCPIIVQNQFADCQLAIETGGLRTKPRIFHNLLQGNRVAILIDDRSAPDVFRNVIKASTVCGVEIRSLADPNIVQNLLEDHTDKEACALKVTLSGAGVVGNNKFQNNGTGMLVECNASSWVGMLNSFERHSQAAAVFHEQCCGHFTRNQCSGNTRCDVLVSGGPALSGLFVERNGFVVSGTGVRVDGLATSPCTISQNRFYGAAGTAVNVAKEGSCRLLENLVHGLNEGLRVETGCQSDVEACLFAGCQIGVKVMGGSDTKLKDSTILGCTSHALISEDEAQCQVSSCRIGMGLAVKPLLLLKGTGEVKECLIFEAQTLIQCAEKCTVVVQRNTLRDGKTGMVFSPETNVMVKGNAIQRNEVGVSILTGAGGTLQNNSIFSNSRCALQVALPNSCSIIKNFLAQDAEANPSISGVQGNDLAALAKANNAVGHGGRAEGGEKLIVPSTVPKVISKEDCLLLQFHKFLTMLGVPPTDSLSAADGNNVQPTPQSFHYGSLIAAAAQRDIDPFVMDAEERIHDLTSRMNDITAAHVKIQGEDPTQKKLMVVSWDVSKPLAKRKSKGAPASPLVFAPIDPNDFGGSEDEDTDQSGDSDSEEERRRIRQKHAARRSHGRSTRARRGGRNREDDSDDDKLKKSVRVNEEEEREKARLAQEEAAAARKAVQDAELARMLEDIKAKENQERAEREALLKPQDNNGAAEGAILTTDVDPPFSLDIDLVQQSPNEVDFGDETDNQEQHSNEETEPLGANSDEKRRQSVVASVSWTRDEQNKQPKKKLHKQSKDTSSGSAPSRTTSNLSAASVLSRKSSRRKKKASDASSMISAGAASAVNQKQQQQRNSGADTKQTMKSVPSFMKPTTGRGRPASPHSGSQTPTTPTSKSHIDSLGLGILPDVPPPPPPPKTEEERRAAAAARLASYQAVWLMVKKKPDIVGQSKLRSLSLAPGGVSSSSRHDASYIQRSKSLVAAGGNEDDASVDNSDRPHRLPPRVTGGNDEFRQTALIITDEHGQMVPSEDIDTVLQNSEVAGMAVVSKSSVYDAEDAAEHADMDVRLLAVAPSSPSAAAGSDQPEVDAIAARFGGAIVLDSKPIEDIRQLVLRRLYLNALRRGVDETNTLDAMQRWFDLLLRGSSIYIEEEEDGSGSGSANDKRESQTSATSTSTPRVRRHPHSSAHLDEEVLWRQLLRNDVVATADGSTFRAQARQPDAHWMSDVAATRNGIVDSLLQLSRSRDDQVGLQAPPVAEGEHTLLAAAAVPSSSMELKTALLERAPPIRSAASSASTTRLRSAAQYRHGMETVAMPQLVPPEEHLHLPPVDENDMESANLLPLMGFLHTTVRTPQQIIHVEHIGRHCKSREGGRRTESCIPPSPPSRGFSGSPSQLHRHHIKVVRMEPVLWVANGGALSATAITSLPRADAPHKPLGDSPRVAELRPVSHTPSVTPLLPPPSPRSGQPRPPASRPPIVFDAARPHETSPFLNRFTPLPRGFTPQSR